MSAHHVIVHYAPPRAGSDGRITVERVGGGTPRSRPADASGLEWAREQCECARRRGFSVDDSALARVTALKVKKEKR